MFHSGVVSLWLYLFLASVFTLIYARGLLLIPTPFRDGDTAIAFTNSSPTFWEWLHIAAMLGSSIIFGIICCFLGKYCMDYQSATTEIIREFSQTLPKDEK